MPSNNRYFNVRPPTADDAASAADRSDGRAWQDLAELMLAGHAPLAFAAGHLLLALQPLMQVLGIPIGRAEILRLVGLPPGIRNPARDRPHHA